MEEEAVKEQLCFLLRVHCWQEALSVPFTRLPGPPSLMKRKDWDTRQSHVMQFTGFVSVLCCGRICPTTKGAPYNRPVHHSINQPKFARGLSVCLLLRREQRHHCGALRILNSSWVGNDSSCKCFEVIGIEVIHSLRLSEEILTSSVPPNQHREMGGLTSADCKSPWKGPQDPHHTIDGSRCEAWRKCNTLLLHCYL
jgi:large subunit ribosomal protein L15e